ncbi:MAG TPA: formate dehydrogenase [Hydrogenophaga sp.]|uniref:formate dehydrogenase n=1 Tax=Hydrogenophaga sp. TaxID=1904254 RepID=UPI002C9CEC2C|nr:formate dehydrogenase [Hydrogenophaga sp.]HSX92136.1 formate dehydrogenase [Hydrogenophaga sp.]
MNESSRPGSAEGRSRLNRRTLFAGAGTVGAVAAVATVMPGVRSPETAAAEPKPAPERGGGYTLSEHVKHYYRTTRI